MAYYFWDGCQAVSFFTLVDGWRLRLRRLLTFSPAVLTTSNVGVIYMDGVVLFSRVILCNLLQKLRIKCDIRYLATILNLKRIDLSHPRLTMKMISRISYFSTPCSSKVRCDELLQLEEQEQKIVSPRESASPI